MPLNDPLVHVDDVEAALVRLQLAIHLPWRHGSHVAAPYVRELSLAQLDECSIARPVLPYPECQPGSRPSGQRRAGADLVVAGVFGYPKLKEKLFARVARDLLARMVVPILMSH
jgi:hypothetical protein